MNILVDSRHRRKLVNEWNYPMKLGHLANAVEAPPNAMHAIW